jgi:hypothetical protein
MGIVHGGEYQRRCSVDPPLLSTVQEYSVRPKARRRPDAPNNTSTRMQASHLQTLAGNFEDHSSR